MKLSESAGMSMVVGIACVGGFYLGVAATLAKITRDKALKSGKQCTAEAFGLEVVWTPHYTAKGLGVEVVWSPYRTTKVLDIRVA